MAFPLIPFELFFFVNQIQSNLHKVETLICLIGQGSVDTLKKSKISKGKHKTDLILLTELEELVVTDLKQIKKQKLQR